MRFIALLFMIIGFNLLSIHQVQSDILITNFVGQVVKIEGTGPSTAKLIIKNISSPQNESITIKLALPQRDGKIEKTNERYKLMLRALSLEPATILNIATMPAKDGVELRSFTVILSPDTSSFQGLSKVKTPAMILPLLRPTANIIVTLDLSAEEKGLTIKKNTPERKREHIAAQQNDLLKRLPKEQFTVKQRLENLPVITGTATLEGLKTLAKDPLVLSIEEDAPVQLFSPQSKTNGDPHASFR